MLIIVTALIFTVVLVNKIFFKGHFELGTFIISISWGVIFPSLFYFFNPKIRHFYVRIFWDEAPDWVQKFNSNRVVEIQLNHY